LKKEFPEEVDLSELLWKVKRGNKNPKKEKALVLVKSQKKTRAFKFASVIGISSDW